MIEKNSVSILLVMIGLSGAASADTRYDQLCITTPGEKHIIFVYNNLNLMSSQKNYENPVTSVDSYVLLNGQVSAGVDATLFDYKNRKNLRRTFYFSNPEAVTKKLDFGGLEVGGPEVVGSTDGRVVVTVNHRTVLSVPFMDPNQNIDGDFGPTMIQQKGLYFNSQPVSRVLYQYCGQLSN